MTGPTRFLPEQAGAKASCKDPRKGCHVLVVEDDYLIAEDLQQAFQREGMVVLGPVPTFDAAMHMIDTAEWIDGAVLDVNLEAGGSALPVADALQALHVPFVFVTGYDRGAIPVRFAGTKLFEKPCDPEQILKALFH